MALVPLKTLNFTYPDDIGNLNGMPPVQEESINMRNRLRSYLGGNDRSSVKKLFMPPACVGRVVFERKESNFPPIN